MPPTNKQYQMNVTWSFVLLSLLGTSFISFFIGYGARIFIAYRLQSLYQGVRINDNLIKPNADPRQLNLPTPVIRRGKEIPHTIYTSKHFDTSRAVSSASLWLESEDSGVVEDQSANNNPQAVGGIALSNSTVIHVEDVGDAQDEEEHLPVGQHLLIDIDNVDSSFLNSMPELASAMVDMVYKCGLTMLSYHCFQLEPSGISCAGVLLESHVAFHTWPEEGVITMDLFTCGPTSLLPIVGFIEDLFSRPRKDGLGEDPKMIWAYKRRGFTNIEVGNHGSVVKSKKNDVTDLFAYPLGIHGMDMKKEVASFETTDLKNFHVYDILHRQSQAHTRRDHHFDEGGNNGLFRPDRLLFSHGALKLRLSGEAASAESLVHPAMFSHPSPKRVAILGSAEGGTLREVLKHNTVDEVTMIGADETILHNAKTHLADWSDCSNLRNVAPSCFDDERVTIFNNEDTQQWLNRISLLGMQERNIFDVIIIDDLIHGLPKSLSESISNDINFVKSLYTSLTDEGVIVVRGVDGRSVKDVPVRHAVDAVSDIKNGSLLRSLETVGFEETRHYQESHGGFGAPQKYVVAFKSSKTAKNWLNDESVLALNMKRRSTPTVDGKTPFLYFDGQTMNSYRTSTSTVNKITCQNDSSAEVCNAFEPFAAPSIRLSKNTCEPSASSSSIQNQSMLMDEPDLHVESSHLTLRVQPFASHIVQASAQNSDVRI